MKNYILLLLIATFGMQAQTYQNPTYGKLKLKTNTQSSAAEKVNVQETDGTLNWQFIKDFQKEKAFLPTGLIKNGILSINAVNTTYDLSSGVGIISNFDDPLNPSVRMVTFPTVIGKTPSYLTTSNITYVGIQEIGTSGIGQIIEQATPFTTDQNHDIIPIGALIHSNLININTVNGITNAANDIGGQFHAFLDAVGAFNVSGNLFSANGANLTLNKSAGSINKRGSNFSTNWKNPNERPQAAATSLTFRYRLADGTEGADRINIDPTTYESGGVILTVPANKFTIQTFNLFQEGAVRAQRGQNVYNSMAEAEQALNTRNFQVESNIRNQSVPRLNIILRNSTTALNNTTDAKLFEIQKFGGVTSGGSAITNTQIIDALGFTPENVANKQNNLAVDGTGVKYATVDAVNTLKWVKSNESLSLAQRKGNVLYGILDQYTGEEMTLSKITTTPIVDGIIYFQLGAEYFKRNYSDINVKWFGAIGNDTSRTIATTFPSVTLSQVQAINPIATLSSQADWYAIQLAVNYEAGATVALPKGTYQIDVPLIFNNIIAFTGIESYSIVKNIGVTKSIIVKSRSSFNFIKVNGNFSSGDAWYIENGCYLNHIEAVGHGGYGIKLADDKNIITFYVKKAAINYNLLGGFYQKSTALYQKNNIVLNEVYCVKNGIDADNLISNGTPNGGNGFYIDGGLSVALKNCVSEYNSGSGVYIDKSTGYTLRGLNLIGTYFEQNKYAELLVDYNGANWQNLLVSASSFSSVTSYPSNSLTPSMGNIAMISRNSFPPGVKFEEFSQVDQKVKFSDIKTSLKKNEMFDFDYASYKGRIDNTSPESEGFNCLRIDQASGGFIEEYSEMFARINSGYSVLVTIEYKAFLDGVGNTNIRLRRKDKNFNAVVGGVDLSATLTQSTTWRRATLLFDKSNFVGGTRFLEFTASLENGTTSNSYFLIKSVKISQLDPLNLLSGTTSERPFSTVGSLYFDTTLNRVIYGGSGGWTDPNSSPTFTGSVKVPTAILATEAVNKGQLDLKANIDSPNLTGVPTAPTAAPGTNTTQIATTGFVQENKSKLKGYTVATLPAGTMGDMAYVTDATGFSYNSPIVGGGSGVVPVFFDGTTWRAH